MNFFSSSFPDLNFGSALIYCPRLKIAQGESELFGGSLRHGEDYQQSW